MKDQYAYNRKIQKFNQQFAKMPSRGDIMFRSMGGGVTYDVKPMSRHAYESKQIAACTVRTYAPVGVVSRFEGAPSTRARKIAARAQVAI